MMRYLRTRASGMGLEARRVREEGEGKGVGCISERQPGNVLLGIMQYIHLYLVRR